MQTVFVIQRSYIIFLGYIRTIDRHLVYTRSEDNVRKLTLICICILLYYYQGTELIFTPSLDYGAPDGFYDIIDGLTADIFKQASKIRRVAKHSNLEYYQVYTNSYCVCFVVYINIINLSCVFLTNVHSCTNEVNSLKFTMLYLWGAFVTDLRK